MSRSMCPEGSCAVSSTWTALMDSSGASIKANSGADLVNPAAASRINECSRRHALRTTEEVAGLKSYAAAAFERLAADPVQGDVSIVPRVGLAEERRLQPADVSRFVGEVSRV